MNFYIVIPAHNEADFLEETLHSLVTQSLPPKKIVVVDDHSTDTTPEIILRFTKKYEFISSIRTSSEKEHTPGSKIIDAFYAGFETLDREYDIICKFDADLIFPKNYLKTLCSTFKSNSKYGMVGGFCFIEKKDSWVLENLTNKDHIRGALKAYRKDCFQQIGGLKKSMGWDTVDELLAQYHGWKIATIDELHVKHLKPTGAHYSSASKLKQGQAFKRMRYGFWLTLIASLKLAWHKKNFLYLINCLQGYMSDHAPYIVTKEEGAFIRKLRWRNIKKKIF